MSTRRAKCTRAFVTGFMYLAISAVPVAVVMAFGVTVLIRMAGGRSLEPALHAAIMSGLAGLTLAGCVSRVNYWWGVTLRRLASGPFGHERVAMRALAAARASAPVAVPTLMAPFDHV